MSARTKTTEEREEKHCSMKLPDFYIKDTVVVYMRVQCFSQIRDFGIVIDKKDFTEEKFNETVEYQRKLFVEWFKKNEIV